MFTIQGPSFRVESRHTPYSRSLRRLVMVSAVKKRREGGKVVPSLLSSV